jgi:murein DD-endopeptidase MepM/ murein hydrolase activator NlpD
LSSVLGVAVLFQGAVLGVVWPRSQALGDAVSENLVLQERLATVEAKITQSERLLDELRALRTRINARFGAMGDHGGPDLPAALEANSSGVGGAPMMDADVVTPGDLRPAESWIIEVERRIEDLFDRYSTDQPDIDRLLVELEGLKSVGEALPGRWPAEGEITSGFGWRTDPVHGGTRFHAGLDIAATRGTPIYAVAPGFVVTSGTNGGYGRMVEIDHGSGIATRYAHCTTLRVKEGERVERGALIATVGSTGKSTGPHLHFEFRIDDSAHDPLDYLPKQR